jgi:hypothetical protein
VQVEEENVHTKNYINEKCVEKNIQRAKIWTDGRVAEQVSDFVYLGNTTSEVKKIMLLSYKDTIKQIV